MQRRADADAAAGHDGNAIVSGLLEEAHSIYTGDRRTCRRMGEIGADLIKDGDEKQHDGLCGGGEVI